MIDRPIEREQHDAFEAYKIAKQKVDETLSFEDARTARDAWWKFLHLFEANTMEPRRP